MHTSNHHWEPLAILVVSVAEAALCGISQILRELPLPAVLVQRLLNAVSVALWTMQPNENRPVRVAFYLQSAAERTADRQPGWGFFLVEKRNQLLTAPALDVHPQRGGQLDIYLYQER